MSGLPAPLAVEGRVYRISFARASAPKGAPHLNLVQADGFELILPGVGDRRVLGVGEQDRRAVGVQQREQLQPGPNRRRLREQALRVLRADRLDIGDGAGAQMRQLLLGQFHRGREFGHRSYSSFGGQAQRLSTRPGANFQSRACTFIFLTTLSGWGFATSIDSRPFASSAPSTCMPSASRKLRWNWRAAMPRWM